jgi:uncharacterized repeat protein (TIGR04138 family)
MVNKAKNYHPAAYRFIRKSLDFALSRLNRHRHISGQELLDAIAEYARLRFGPLTRQVFEEWGIVETLDFGRIVFELVEAGVMTRQPEDSIEDFRDYFNFEEEFDRNYDFLTELRKSGVIPAEKSSPNSHSGSRPGSVGDS